MGLTVGSLFSGIGGLDLGLERAGMEVIWQSEIDPYACKVLSKHWPEVVNHGNIKEINWQEVEKPDVICGGYPCQPFSTAGKRRGEEDSRHLWPWVRTAISELRPRYAILENVRGHLSMGGLSVIGELASIGYDAQWRVVSAASVGANHRRDRIIIVAYPQSQHGNVGDNYTGVGVESKSTAELGNRSGSQDLANPSGERCMDNGVGIFSSEGRLNALGFFGQSSTNVAHADSAPGQQQQEWEVQESNIGGCCSDVADADCGRCQQCQPEAKSIQGASCSCKRNMADTNGIGLERQRPEQQATRIARGSEEEPLSNNERVRDGEHRITADAGQENSGGIYNGRRETGYDGWQWWETEPDVGRVANGVPRRVDRLRGLGNAVVPQVAEVIGRLVISDYQSRED
jgi:DNA (cytosine-5)-methyltransferase 1